MTINEKSSTLMRRVHQDARDQIFVFFTEIAQRFAAEIKRVQANRSGNSETLHLMDLLLQHAAANEMVWPTTWVESLDHAVFAYCAQKEAQEAKALFDNTLQLVGEQEMDLQLAVSKVAKVIQERSTKSYTEVLLRLSALWEEEDLDPNNPMPYKPDQIILVILATFKEYSLDLAEHALKLLFPDVVKDFDPLYAALNYSLESAGVHFAPPSNFARNRERADSRFGSKQTESMGSSEATKASEAALLDKLERFLSGHASATNQFVGNGAVVPSAIYQPMPQGYVPVPVSPDFMNWLSTAVTQAEALLPLSSNTGMSSIPSTVPAPVQVDPIFWQLLTQLQKTPPGNLPGAIQTSQGIAPSSDTFRALLENLPQVSTNERRVTELVQAVFDSVIESTALPDSVRDLVEHLRMPVLRSSLMDKSFFVDEANPVRKFVSAIVGLAESLPPSVASDDPLLNKASDLVSRVKQDFDLDQSVFVSSLEDLQQFQEAESEAIAERLAPLQAEVQQQEKTAWAHERAKTYLDEKFEKVMVPGFLSSFLYEDWLKFIAQTEMSDGVGSDSLLIMQQLTEELVWSITPKTDGEGRRSMVDRVPALIKNLSARLKQLDYSSDKRTTFMSSLNSFLTALIKSRVALQDLDAGRSPPVLRVQRGKKESQDEFTEQVKALQVGTWMSFVDKEDNEKQYQLSWVSPMRSKYLFSNRQGMNSFSMAPHELAGEFRAGRARFIQQAAYSDSIIDRVVESMIDQYL